MSLSRSNFALTSFLNYNITYIFLTRAFRPHLLFLSFSFPLYSLCCFHICFPPAFFFFNPKVFYLLFSMPILISFWILVWIFFSFLFNFISWERHFCSVHLNEELSVIFRERLSSSFTAVFLAIRTVFGALYVLSKYSLSE